ncbi:hypothetical protein ACQ5SK_27025 [Bradyrhizobium japonicum]
MDDQRFSRNILPDDKQLTQVMVRRLKADLVDKDGKALYPKRKLQALSVPFTADEREIHRLLDRYAKSREKDGRQAGNAGTDFVNGLLKKRLFSSPAAFSSTLETHFATLEGKRTEVAPDAMADRILRKAVLKAEEDYADDAEVEAAHTEAIDELSRYAPPLSDEQRKMLERLRVWAQDASHKPDSKATAIVAWIEANLKTDGQWNDRRVILFTEYRTTHRWLQEILAARGYGGDRLGIIHGGMDHDERERSKPLSKPIRGFGDPNPSRDRCRVGRHRLAELLRQPNSCGDSLQS